MCESSGLLNISSKQNQHKQDEVDITDDLDQSAYEAMLIQLDQESPNELLDNVLYYIAGFVVRSLLKGLKCDGCRSALLLDADDPHALHKGRYPLHAKLACFKQSGGLIFPSQSVLKIVKAVEVLFKNRVLFKDQQISFEKNLELKIQYGVLQQLGPDIFTRSSGHFFDHTIGEKCDHLSSLLKLVTKKYISLRMKTYGKQFTEMVVHKNNPSIHHQLTRTILFRNQ